MLLSRKRQCTVHPHLHLCSEHQAFQIADVSYLHATETNFLPFPSLFLYRLQ